MFQGDGVVLEGRVPVRLGRVTRVARLGAKGEIGEIELRDHLRLLLKPRQIPCGLDPRVREGDADKQRAYGYKEKKQVRFSCQHN
jgi:hypothetical protein